MNRVAHRMKRLRGDRAHFALLALDHGLTYGSTSEVVPLPLPPLLDKCSGLFGGFVATYGLARRLVEWPSQLSLVLQCFGAPEGLSRRKLSTLEQAIFLDAAAVSVQLSWSDPDFSSRLQDICSFTQDAHSVGIPVLFMVGGDTKTSELGHKVRICQEMGADMIKVNCTKDQFVCDSGRLNEMLSVGPPVVMAGGESSGDLVAIARNAAKLGVTGYCVGRHIFQSPEPESVSVQLNSIFEHAARATSK